MIAVQSSSSGLESFWQAEQTTWRSLFATGDGEIIAAHLERLYAYTGRGYPDASLAATTTSLFVDLVALFDALVSSGAIRFCGGLYMSLLRRVLRHIVTHSHLNTVRSLVSKIATLSHDNCDLFAEEINPILNMVCQNTAHFAACSDALIECVHAFNWGSTWATVEWLRYALTDTERGARHLECLTKRDAITRFLRGRTEGTIAIFVTAYKKHPAVSVASIDTRRLALVIWRNRNKHLLWDLIVRRQLIEVAIALRPLNLGALQTLAIVDALTCNQIPMHRKWSVIAAIKHFGQ